METMTDKTISRIQQLTREGKHCTARIALAQSLRQFDLNLRARALYERMLANGSVIGLGDLHDLYELLAIGANLISRFDGEIRRQIISCL